MTLASDSVRRRADPKPWSLAKRRGAASAACVLLALSWPASAGAQDGQERAIARDLAVQGAVAFEQGDLPTALDRFNRAAELFDAPSISVMQARVLVRLGRWVEALDRYHAALQFPLTPAAPEPYHKAQREAVEEVARLEPQVPHLEIRVTHSASSPETEVRLDGKVVPAVLLNVERPVDPGEHTIEFVRAGTAVTSQRLTVVAGEHKLYTFDNVASSPPPPTSRPTLVSAPAPYQDAALQEPTPSWIVPVAFSVGGTATAAAVFTGVRAMALQSDLEDACLPGCPSSMQDTLSSYRTYRAVFYTSLGVGLLGVGVGSYFAFLAPTPKEQQPQLLLTLHSVTLAGRF